MNIENLRNFIKLTQYRSFSELARHISLSQSTLSHQISQLEKEFGNVILIDRTTKKFELTEAGKILLDYAEQIVSLFDKCMEEISQYTEQQKEEIIISASTIPGSHILPKFITEFKEDNMNVQFKIMINNSKESIEHLKRNEANFAGIGSFMSYKESSFDVIKIGQDNFKFICSPNHNLLKDGSNKVHFKIAANDNYSPLD